MNPQSRQLHLCLPTECVGHLTPVHLRWRLHFCSQPQQQEHPSTCQSSV